MKKVFVCFASIAGIGFLFVGLTLGMPRWREKGEVAHLQKFIEDTKRAELSGVTHLRVERRLVPPGILSTNTAYVIDWREDRLMVLFPTSIRQETVNASTAKDEKKTLVSGYLYSENPLSRNQWIDISKAVPSGADVNPWDSDPIQKHWYFVSPYESN